MFPRQAKRHRKSRHRFITGMSIPFQIICLNGDGAFCQHFFRFSVKFDWLNRLIRMFWNCEVPRTTESTWSSWNWNLTTSWKQIDHKSHAISIEKTNKCIVRWRGSVSSWRSLKLSCSPIKSLFRFYFAVFKFKK